MRIISLFSIFSIALFLLGCASTMSSDPSKKASPPQKAVKKPTSLSQAKKNPISIKVYSGDLKPEKPYVILGQQTVSKYNAVGIKRQEANIRDTFRHMAANVGGDAIIEMTTNTNSISGTIIAFKEAPIPDVNSHS